MEQKCTGARIATELKQVVGVVSKESMGRWKSATDPGNGRYHARAH